MNLSNYELGRGSLANLVDVEQPLVMVVRLAIKLCEVDFSVIDGVRTLAQQRVLFDNGDSFTMDSKHLTGEAVDIAAWVDGKSNFEWHYLYMIRDAMFLAAKILDVDIEWGGNWKFLKDGPHWQLC